MSRKIIYREVPKPPGPTGEIFLALWQAVKDRYSQDWNEYEETYLESGDIDWLRGFLSATPGDTEKGQIFDLIEAIKKLGQVEVVWVNE